MIPKADSDPVCLGHVTPAGPITMAGNLVLFPLTKCPGWSILLKRDITTGDTQRGEAMSVPKFELMLSASNRNVCYRSLKLAESPG